MNGIAAEVSVANFFVPVVQAEVVIIAEISTEVAGYDLDALLISKRTGSNKCTDF